MAEPEKLPAGFFARIPITTKIERAGERVKMLLLRDLYGPALMDVSIYELMRMDGGEIIKVLPKISEPPLMAEEAAMMHGRDLFEIGQEISAFLLFSESE